MLSTLGKISRCSDTTRLSNILRHNSTVPRAKNCSVGKKESLVARDGHLKSTSKNSLASPGDPLACLSRYYGGSKRNALLKWCQEKTSVSECYQLLVRANCRQLGRVVGTPGL